MGTSEIEIEKIKKEIDAANDLVWLQRNSPSTDYDPAAITSEALAKSKDINYEYGIARSTLNWGMAEFIVGNDHKKAFQLFDNAISMFDKLQDQKWLSNAYITRAIFCNSIGQPEIALYDGLKGIHYYEEHHKDGDLSMAFYVMGTIYKDLKKYKEAERYYREGIENDVTSNTWTGRIYASLAGMLTDRQEYKQALEYGMKSLDILQGSNNLIGQSRALSDIGVIYKKLYENKLALDYFFKALEIRKTNNLKHFILASLIDIAEVYVQMGDEQNAISYFEQAEQYAGETSHFARQVIVYRNLSEIYKKRKDFEKVVEIYEKLLKINERVHTAEREAKLNQSESKLLKEKEEEIERLKNIELKKAYEVIEQRNKDIHDSITYAKRIQDALLAHEGFLKENLPEHFVYFDPKDIVSGDFYWATKVSRRQSPVGSKQSAIGSSELPTATENCELFYLAVCDSTGHGVPGAFMSLLNIGFLTEAINEKDITKPNEVLDFVRQRLIDNISKEGQKDGFDGILMCMERSANGTKITYAAANNVPVIIKNGAVTELEADHMPVGMGEGTTPFKLISIQANKGDMLYLYTDGYADQFGGPKGKKFKSKQLNTLLQEISQRSMEDQKNILAKTFEEWKGTLEQVDDVCIVGIRI
jgi:serine phosphatase RsbU (regulator of sigma subunit)